MPRKPKSSPAWPTLRASLEKKVAESFKSEAIESELAALKKDGLEPSVLLLGPDLMLEVLRYVPVGSQIDTVYGLPVIEKKTKGFRIFCKVGE